MYSGKSGYYALQEGSERSEKEEDWLETSGSKSQRDEFPGFCSCLTYSKHGTGEVEYTETPKGAEENQKPKQNHITTEALLSLVKGIRNGQFTKTEHF